MVNTIIDTISTAILNIIVNTVTILALIEKYICDY